MNEDPVLSWGKRDEPYSPAEVLDHFEGLAAVSTKTDPRSSSALREILQSAHVQEAWPKVLRYCDNNIYSLQVLIGFVASLPTAWQSGLPIPQKTLQKKVRRTVDACSTAAALLRRHAAELAAWNSQPVSTIALRENLERFFISRGTAGPDDLSALKALISGDNFANVEAAIPQIAALLERLVQLTEVSRVPASIAVMPTKPGAADTARTVFYIRALTWFFLTGDGKPHDLLAATFASALSGEAVDEDRVKKRRKEMLQKNPSLKPRARLTL